MVLLVVIKTYVDLRGWQTHNEYIKVEQSDTIVQRVMQSQHTQMELVLQK